MRKTLGKTKNEFATVASDYAVRYRYGQEILDLLRAAKAAPSGVFADLGAGTGTLTQMIAWPGWRGYAVEPSDEMRDIGQGLVAHDAIDWRDGTAEASGLPDQSIDWCWMGDAFHWAEADAALAEIRRILKPGGQFTAIWCLRDLHKDSVQRQVDEFVREHVPGIRRVYEDIVALFPLLPDALTGQGQFGNCVHLEGWHTERTHRDTYLQMLRFSFDIRSQAGPQRFQALLDEIEMRLRQHEYLELSYNTRSWTVSAI